MSIQQEYQNPFYVQMQDQPKQQQPNPNFDPEDDQFQKAVLKIVQKALDEREKQDCKARFCVLLCVILGLVIFILVFYSA